MNFANQLERLWNLAWIHYQFCLALRPEIRFVTYIVSLIPRLPVDIIFRPRLTFFLFVIKLQYSFHQMGMAIWCCPKIPQFSSGLTKLYENISRP
jgi:hypothetical protein